VVQVGSEADDSASGGRAAKLKGKKQSVRVKEAEPREKESAGEKLLGHLSYGHNELTSFNINCHRAPFSVISLTSIIFACLY
jgi:hypothetical protein